MIIKDKIGNEALLDRVKTLFLCSKQRIKRIRGSRGQVMK